MLVFLFKPTLGSICIMLNRTKYHYCYRVLLTFKQQWLLIIDMDFSESSLCHFWLEKNLHENWLITRIQIDIKCLQWQSNVNIALNSIQIYANDAKYRANFGASVRKCNTAFVNENLFLSTQILICVPLFYCSFCFSFFLLQRRIWGVAVAKNWSRQILCKSKKNDELINDIEYGFFFFNTRTKPWTLLHCDLVLILMNNNHIYCVIFVYMFQMFVPAHTHTQSIT